MWLPPGSSRIWLTLAALSLSGLAVGRDGSDTSIDGRAPYTQETCESRTINYITHTLPQQCLRTAWSSANSTVHTEATATPTATAGNEAEPTVLNGTQGERPGDNVTEESKGAEPQKDAKEEDTDSGDLATSSFMSFEEWKEMQLRKAGQDPAELKARKQQEGRGDGYINSGHGDLDSLGDDAEIALDFDVLSDKISEISASTRPSPSSVIRKDIAEEPILYDDGMAQYPRPKDAGKTCKERFSFSSFDGGATVLKTSPGAKNSKAILLENKDSYMLFTCSQQNKFVIVELSEDILVDTVVLANFEFFSSMVRLFRVSVSDRYPVKIDKWKDIGTFEARNSRDLQPFLVENPKIWAKYIRIEFLTHYGNEYYCPISLLRVHGTRMLDSWKDAEGSREEDEAEETISGPEPVPEQEPLSDNKTAEPEVAPPATTDMNSNASEAILEMGLSPWYPTFYPGPLFETCATGTPTTTETVRVSPPVEEMTNMVDLEEQAPNTNPSSATGSTVEGVRNTSILSAANASALSGSASPSPMVNGSAPAASMTAVPEDRIVANITQVAEDRSSETPTGSSSSSSPISKPPTSSKIPVPPSSKSSSVTHTTPRNKTSTASASNSSPTVQESFFKTVSKRLQLLESNTTLSLQYIEDQSKFLQEALQKMERKQISRVDSFLDNLNKTVLSELHNVRQQYDQIWQSTVIALETQREQSQREVVALTSRLNLLADEVVFQKRMAILQSVLLLACLLLVIFSRGLVGNTIDLAFPQMLGNTNLMTPTPPSAPVEGFSSPESPTPLRNRVAHSVQGDHRVHPLTRSDSYSEKVLPLTPTSDYGHDGTPPAIHIDEPGEFFSNMQSYTPSQELRLASPPLEDLEGSVSPPPAVNRDALDHGVEDASKPPLTRSSLSQISNPRKPLPALPEDPS